MDATVWEKARRVAILADVGGALPAVWALRTGDGLLAKLGGLPDDLPTPTEEERLWLDLRFAELVRRFLPDEALKVLAGLPPLAESGGLSGPAIEAAARIEAGQLDAAEARLMLAPGENGARALLHGRLALERGQLAEAIAGFTQALELASDPEIQAEALCFRARARRLGALDAHADLDALEALAAAHGAGVTVSLARLLRASEGDEAVGVLQGAFYRVGLAQQLAPLTLGVEKDRDSLGSVPLHVHGAAKKHATDAAAFVGALLPVASLQLAVHADVDAYETAWYGFAIGQRLHGRPAVIDLAAFLAGMRDGLGTDAFAAVQAQVEARAQAASRGLGRA